MDLKFHPNSESYLLVSFDKTQYSVDKFNMFVTAVCVLFLNLTRFTLERFR